MRKIFEVNGGNLGPTNCVGWMFDRKGLFIIPASSIEESKLFDIALEAGAEDVQPYDGAFEVTCDPTNFEAVRIAFQDQHVACDSAEVTRIAQNTVELDLDQTRQIMKLLEALEDNDDVQSVTSNFSSSAEIMEAIAAEA